MSQPPAQPNMHKQSSKHLKIQEKKRCLIIGGGASGVITALELESRCGEHLDITIVEPNAELGRGQAYVKTDVKNANQDLLNVPAGKMSPSVALPDDFVNWLKVKGSAESQYPYWPYVPRVIFGDYLSEKISQRLSPSLRHVKSRVTDLAMKQRFWCAQLDSGEKIQADFVVISSGYVAPRSPVVSKTESNKKKRILVVGSGLSAIDLWRRCAVANEAEIVFLSRHGLLSMAQPADPKPVNLPRLSGMSPHQILRVVRSLQRVGQLAWQDLADGIRTEAQSIWSCWTERERKQFLRHIKTYWEVMRHRLPLKMGNELQAALDAGQVHIIAGRLTTEPESTADGIKVSYVPRGHSSVTSECFDTVFFATGTRIDQSLSKVARSFASARFGPCPLGFGYKNMVAPRLWLMGPASKSLLWEITAVPEIRVQAHRTAKEIAATLHQASQPFMESFNTHPRLSGESYWGHFQTACKFSRMLAGSATVSFVHAVFPNLFVETASERLRDLAYVLFRRRAQRVNFKSEAIRNS